MEENKFEEEENVACVVCDHVINEEREINLVAHDIKDGQWSFLCGEDDHSMENYNLVTIKSVIEIDCTVNEVADLPLGHEARRDSITHDWTR